MGDRLPRTMNLGDAYYFPDGHLTFVISLPDERTGDVVIVNISRTTGTLRPRGRRSWSVVRAT